MCWNREKKKPPVIGAVPLLVAHKNFDPIKMLLQAQKRTNARAVEVCTPNNCKGDAKTKKLQSPNYVQKSAPSI